MRAYTQRKTCMYLFRLSCLYCVSRAASAAGSSRTPSHLNTSSAACCSAMACCLDASSAACCSAMACCAAAAAATSASLASRDVVSLNALPALAPPPPSDAALFECERCNFVCTAGGLPDDDSSACRTSAKRGREEDTDGGAPTPSPNTG